MLHDVYYAFSPERQTKKTIIQFCDKNHVYGRKEKKKKNVEYLVISFHSSGVSPVGVMLHFPPSSHSASITIKTREITGALRDGKTSGRILCISCKYGHCYTCFDHPDRNKFWKSVCSNFWEHILFQNTKNKIPIKK